MNTEELLNKALEKLQELECCCNKSKKMQQQINYLNELLVQNGIMHVSELSHNQSSCNNKLACNYTDTNCLVDNTTCIYEGDVCDNGVIVNCKCKPKCEKQSVCNNGNITVISEDCSTQIIKCAKGQIPNEDCTKCIKISEGCTNSTACNYNPAATQDDGSCNYGTIECEDPCKPIIGCMDSSACDFNDKACIDDRCNYTDCKGICGGTDQIGTVCIDSNGEKSLYDEDCNCPTNNVGCQDPGACNFKFEDELECWYVGEPCTTLDGNTGIVLQESTQPCECVGNTVISGCTNPCSPNYNSEVLEDNGSCQPESLGCLDTTACNYDPNAICSNNNCDYGNTNCQDPCNPISGCTDTLANNYDINACISDNSCIYSESSYCFCPDNIEEPSFSKVCQSNNDTITSVDRVFIQSVLTDKNSGQSSAIIKARILQTQNHVISLNGNPVSSSIQNGYIISQINNLVPNTVYEYSINYNGSGQQSIIGWFKTPPLVGSKDKVNFWVVGDGGEDFQDRIEEMRDAHFSFTGENLDESTCCNTDFNTTDLFINLGDNAYNHGRDQELEDAVFSPFKKILKNIPLYSTIGNHESDYNNTYGGEDLHKQLFCVPENIPISKYNKSYYSFDYADVHFVCLYTQFYTTEYNYSENPKTSYDQMFDWLRTDLTNAKQSKWTVVYFHKPIYGAGGRQGRSSTEDSLGNDSQDMRIRMDQIIRDFDIDLVLTGHSHHYERSYLLKVDGPISDSYGSFDIMDYGCVGNVNCESTSNYDDILEKIEGPNSGTVFLTCGISSKNEQYSCIDSSDDLYGHKSTQDFLNHPGMRLFRSPAQAPAVDTCTTDSPKGSIINDGGRGYSDKEDIGSMHFEINDGVLKGTYITRNGITLDQFEIRKKCLEECKTVEEINGEYYDQEGILINTSQGTLTDGGCNATCEDKCAPNFGEPGECEAYPTGCNQDCTRDHIRVWDPNVCGCVVETLSVPGCTDPDAQNYNPNATCENNTCDYSRVEYCACNENDCQTIYKDIDSNYYDSVENGQVVNTANLTLTIGCCQGDCPQRCLEDTACNWGEEEDCKFFGEQCTEEGESGLIDNNCQCDPNAAGKCSSSFCNEGSYGECHRPGRPCTYDGVENGGIITEDCECVPFDLQNANKEFCDSEMVMIDGSIQNVEDVAVASGVKPAGQSGSAGREVCTIFQAIQNLKNGSVSETVELTYSFVKGGQNFWTNSYFVDYDDCWKPTSEANCNPGVDYCFTGDCDINNCPSCNVGGVLDKDCAKINCTDCCVPETILYQQDSPTYNWGDAGIPLSDYIDAAKWAFDEWKLSLEKLAPGLTIVFKDLGLETGYDLFDPGTNGDDSAYPITGVPGTPGQFRFFLFQILDKCSHHQIAVNQNVSDFSTYNRTDPSNPNSCANQLTNLNTGTPVISNCPTSNETPYPPGKPCWFCGDIGAFSYNNQGCGETDPSNLITNDGGNIGIDVNNIFTKNNTTYRGCGQDLYWVIAHEIGHSLGIPHASINNQNTYTSQTLMSSWGFGGTYKLDIEAGVINRPCEEPFSMCVLEKIYCSEGPPSPPIENTLKCEDCSATNYEQDADCTYTNCTCLFTEEEVPKILSDLYALTSTGQTGNLTFNYTFNVRNNFDGYVYGMTETEVKSEIEASFEQYTELFNCLFGINITFQESNINPVIQIDIYSSSNGTMSASVGGTNNGNCSPAQLNVPINSNWKLDCENSPGKYSFQRIFTHEIGHIFKITHMNCAPHNIMNSPALPSENICDDYNGSIINDKQLTKCIKEYWSNPNRTVQTNCQLN